MMIYQPFPLEIQRNDCEERYQAIRKHCNFKNKSLIDICCANGYFGFRFMQDGGCRTFGIERNLDYINLVNLLAKIDKVNFRCDFVLPREKFDIGIYLDTHYAKNTEGYLKYLADMTVVCFISSSGNNEKLKSELKQLFKRVEPIYKGFNERIIYRCE